MNQLFLNELPDVPLPLPENKGMKKEVLRKSVKPGTAGNNTEKSKT